jgi:hypothetical protein
MAETFVLSFVDKLILLEQKTGSRVHYRIMPPLSGPLDDCISIQKVAKQIADSIDLSQFTFIITFAKQKKNVGGHIDLSTMSREVFIEIDPDALSFPDSVAATLCHEICHKWLQMMGIASPIEMENEILTDITTVFLGFGKIMLNGCELKGVTRAGTTTTTQTRKCGYLTRDQLAFVYRLVCSMRGIPFSECMSGLSREASDSIRACDRSFGHYYAERFHRVETTMDALKDFQRKNVYQQWKLAELSKYLDYVKQSLCETGDRFLVTAHRTSRELSQKAETIAQGSDHDPALRFLRSIRKSHELEQLATEIAAVGSRSQDLLWFSKLIGIQLRQRERFFPRPSVTMFNIVKCPQDGTKLRLPKESPNLMVSCPTCRYRFPYNTKCISFPTDGFQPKQRDAQRRREDLDWTERLWRFFKSGGFVTASERPG